MAELLKGAPVAAALTEQLSQEVADLKERGITPTLAIVRVGERADDLSYERGALKRAEKVGVAVKQFVLPADCTQDELLATIDEINADDTIHGCLMFRPLPTTLDEAAACAALDPAKDVDCITEGSLYGVFADRPKGFPPCTAAACLEILDYYGYGELTGALVTVVGCSLVVGKPLAVMLQAKNATVTMSHIFTKDVPAECVRADIIIVATGHIGTVNKSCVSPGQVVIDVGINWDEDAQKLVGDVSFDEVEPIVSAITPVPGGVGSVTTAVLCKHVVEAAKRSAG